MLVKHQVGMSNSHLSVKLRGEAREEDHIGECWTYEKRHEKLQHLEIEERESRMAGQRAGKEPEDCKSIGKCISGGKE